MAGQEGLEPPKAVLETAVYHWSYWPDVERATRLELANLSWKADALANELARHLDSHKG